MQADCFADKIVAEEDGVITDESLANRKRSVNICAQTKFVINRMYRYIEGTLNNVCEDNKV